MYNLAHPCFRRTLVCPETSATTALINRRLPHRPWPSRSPRPGSLQVQAACEGLLVEHLLDDGFHILTATTRNEANARLTDPKRGEHGACETLQKLGQLTNRSSTELRRDPLSAPLSTASPNFQGRSCKSLDCCVLAGRTGWGW